jgi:flagellar hook-length control protein FliK
MSTPSSVTGPDRRPTTDTGRRTGSRRSEDGEDFGSALSAELKNKQGDARLSPADRAAAQDRFGREQASHREATADRADAHRAATQRAAAERAASDRAADRAAAARAAAARATQERITQDKLAQT